MDYQKEYYLSKSRFMAGLRCPKALYLNVHSPELLNDAHEISLSIINGNAIGAMACQLFPGVMVKHEEGLSAAITQTERLIVDDAVTRIHEATFSYDNVLVRVDLLERTDMGWSVTEVKGSTSVNEHHINDAAIQAWVLKECGLKIVSINLMYVNDKFVYQGKSDYQNLLCSQDISDEVFESLNSIRNKKQALMGVLEDDTPDIEIGSQCYSPFDCEFISTCQSANVAEYPISILPRINKGRVKVLSDAGYNDVREIPKGILTNANHQRVWRATCTGEEEVDVSELRSINEWGWPRYYIDFETIALAVPIWEGVKPYMQVPFQWSCHIHYPNGRVEHVKFLDVTGNDPRRACAESLVSQIGKEGVLIAYNAGFEKGVIRHLADLCPDLSESLTEMNQRFVDLLQIIRDGYYHPSQYGSWSIKAVLPTLVPELSYSDLDSVQNGSDAQLAWIQASESSAEKRDEIGNQLLEYCKLDTWAMVKIVEALKEKIPIN